MASATVFLQSPLFQSMSRANIPYEREASMMQIKIIMHESHDTAAMFSGVTQAL